MHAGSRPNSAGARPSSAEADEFAPAPGLRGKIAGGWSATTSGIRNHNPLHRTSGDRPSADVATAHPQQSKVRLCRVLQGCRRGMRAWELVHVHHRPSGERSSADVATANL